MYKISHIQYKVEKIEDGIKKFSELGFKVERGGYNSRNAFIWFSEGPFIELLEMPRYLSVFSYLFGAIYGKPMKYRWKKWCTEDMGFIDFALEPIDKFKLNINNFNLVKCDMEERRLKSSRIITWSRKNIRKEKVKFSYLPISPSSLPFIVSEYDKPQKPLKTRHKNQAYRLKKLQVYCSKQDFSKFKELLKEEPIVQVKKSFGFSIKDVVIEDASGLEIMNISNNITVEGKKGEQNGSRKKNS